VLSTWADSGFAARSLGYRPRVGLEEGIAAQVGWAASLQNLAGVPA
jgi:nucleoside-diphosphate-sugar epimerase